MESILAIVCSGSSLFHSYPGIIASKLALEAYLNSPIELILLSRSHFLKVSRALKIQNMNLKETFHFGAINAFLPTPPPRLRLRDHLGRVSGKIGRLRS